MFLEYFGLREQPFGVTPDPRYLFPSPGHREALASLIYGIESNLGFGSLIAKPGMGKTTLLFHILERYRTSARTAFIFNTQCNSYGLLRSLLNELDDQPARGELFHLHERFKHILAGEAEKHRRVILVIDEAQNLGEAVLETIRLLSNFESVNSKLLHIVLAGQPELAAKLARPELSQLQQRIPILTSLHRLSPNETTLYVEHRLRIAGHQGIPLFTQRAIGEIGRLSRGVPREINRLCFNCLSLAYASSKKVVDLHVVEEVASDLNLNQRLRKDEDEYGLGQPESTGNAASGALHARPAFSDGGPSLQTELCAHEVSNASPLPIVPAAPGAILVHESENHPGPQDFLVVTEVAADLNLNQRLRKDRDEDGLSELESTATAASGALRAGPISFQGGPSVKTELCVSVVSEATLPIAPAAPGGALVRESENHPGPRTLLAAGQPKAPPVLSFTCSRRRLDAPGPLVLAIFFSILIAAAFAAMSQWGHPEPATNRSPLASSAGGNASGEQALPRDGAGASPDRRPVSAQKTRVPKRVRWKASQQSSVVRLRNFTPPRPATDGHRREMGGSFVASPELVGYTLPSYPDEALLRRIEGTVVLRAVVTGNGTVKSVTPVSGNLILSRSAESAVRNWVYRRQNVNGASTDVSTEIVIDFFLPKKRSLRSQAAYPKSLPE